MPARIPLSFQQKWLWSLAQQRHSWSCVLGYAYRLLGPLDIDALRQSLERVIARHSSLRTAVVTDDAATYQEISEITSSGLDVVDIMGDSAEQIAAKARKLSEEFCEQDIDPSVLPLIKARLLKLAGREHILALVVHRMIADCFSVDQVVRESWTEYGRVVTGLPPEPSPPASQYSDYAIRQRQNHPQWLQKHRDYWKDRIEGAAILRWPLENSPDGNLQGTVGRMKRFLGGELSGALQDSARRAHTLAATVMLAIYVAVLSKWCKQTDFIVPFNIAGRQSEHKAVVGYFSHIVLLRMRLTGNESFKELLSLASNEFFRALSHQDFGMMADQHPELLAGTYFQWVSWHEDDPAAATGFPLEHPLQLKTERLQLREFGEGITAIPPGMVDVEVTFFDTKEGIHARGVYRADRFGPSTMERFLIELQSATERFVSDPLARAVIP